MGRQKGRAGKQMGTGEKSEMHRRKEINFLQRKVYRGREKIFRESPAI